MHHTLLHKPKSSPTQLSAATNCGATMPHYADNFDCDNENRTCRSFHDILPVRVRCENVEVLTYALLDSGSSLSFCGKRLVDALGANNSGTPTKASLETLTTKGPKKFDTKEFNFDVLPLNGSSKFKMSKVTMIDKIPVNLASRNVCKRLDLFEHLRGVELPVVDNATVTLLIGNDNAMLQFPVEVRAAPNPSKEPQAIRTPLGWVLKGPNAASVPAVTPIKPANLFLNSYGVPDHMGDLSSQLVTEDGEVFPSPFDFDAINVEDLMHWLKPNREMMEFGLKYSREDVVAYDVMSRSVSHVDGHFQLPLLWKDASAKMPDSEDMARRRLEAVKRRLQRDSQLNEKYCEQMDVALSKGYAEVVPVEENNGRVWYIPHHPVLNPRKPEKVRIVYDCAARSSNISLNDKLMTGPDLVNKLFKVLLRFRKNKIAIVSDVEAMFYQVLVDPEDKDSLRFLWWPGGNLDLEPIPHRMRVHLFGAKSSPSCAAFALRHTAKEFGKFFDPEVAEAVLKCFYVDDLLTSVKDEMAAVKLIQDLRRLLQMGGFRLTKWISTSKTVMESIPEEDRAKAVQDLCISNVENRVLGMTWNIETDLFRFEVRVEDKPLTRRFILSVTNRLFDPLGLVAPVVVEARLIFREICKQKIGWDETLPASFVSRWNSWTNTLEGLNEITIPRCFKSLNEKIKNLQLHVFSDASILARGAICYLRIEYENDLVNCSIVMAKAYLATSENMTIPRMELEAALDGVRLARMVKDEFDLSCRCSYWTDSAIVLQSIHADSKRFPVFARNRLAQIERNTCVYDWRHIPTELNPADLISRGARATELVNKSEWFEGPAFLKLPPEKWPNRFEKKSATNEEIFQTFNLPGKCDVSLFACVVEGGGMDRLIGYFSSFYRLKVAVAWLLRVKACLCERLRCSNALLSLTSIAVPELKDAEINIIRYVQQLCFADSYRALVGGRHQSILKSSPLYKLNPIVVDGVMRVGGRLDRAYLDFDVKHPIVLPGDHHLTDLIIQDVHFRIVGHLGVDATLNQIRKNYWIINAKVAIRRILKDCVICKRRDGRPGNQIMAELPTARLQINEPPFSCTGVDYFEPLLVRQGRSNKKRYGCLFTCLTSRAIHLELAADLTTSSFINAFRRFIARRGSVVQQIISDNATNFVGCNREFRAAIKDWNQQQIHNCLRQRNIEWTFNPPGASHMGGSWERMIRTVRRIMMAVISGQGVTDDSLHTILLEVEAMVNSRPLCISLELGSDVPLTSNHLLRVEPSVGLAPIRTTSNDCYARQRYRLVQRVADQFWARWVDEYAKTIMLRKKWHEPKRNLCEGDIVLVLDSNAPRGHWPIGKVIKTYPDKQDVVRSVTVKTALGESKRPITKLCVILQAGSHEEEEELENVDD